MTNGELIEMVVNAIADFDDWEWCKCSECMTDARSHAVDTVASMSALANEIRKLMEPERLP